MDLWNIIVGLLILVLSCGGRSLAYKVVQQGNKNIESKSCDYFEGSWVYGESYPLYNASSCPFIGFNCLNNGRPDHDYLKYRWKPNACDLPRYLFWFL